MVIGFVIFPSPAEPEYAHSFPQRKTPGFGDSVALKI
jgi:hypothetical protein